MTPTFAPTVPQFAMAGLFLEKLATADFSQLADALEADATLMALLPRGLKEWQGGEAICGAFETFFGGMDEYKVLDAEVGHIGSRLQLRWRLHVRGARLGETDFVVEQHCYADSGPTGRIQTMSMVCSGFCQEHAGT